MALQNCSIWNMQTFLGNTYHIPDYQREYSWEADELGDFWDDLETTRQDSDQAPHFFGQIVVHHDEKAKYIIDGQQRTITSVIFLRALQLFYEDIYLATQNPDADERRTDITSMYIGRYTSKGNKLHLNLNAMDSDYFRDNIQLGRPNPKNKEKKRSHEKMRKAYVFFYEKIEAALSDYSPNEIDDRIELLDSYFETFSNRFEVLYMEATRLEEAFVIFETLNARGKDLETADLLKNYIFSQSKDITLAQKKWNSMVGILDKVDPTKYIRHFWNSRHDFTRDKTLYRTISKEIATPKSSRDLLNDLESCAPYYHAMAFPEDDMIFQNDKLINSLKSLRTLKARSFYPVILAMKQADITFEDKDIAIVASTIETYMLRNFTICGKVANQSERFFAATAKDIYDGKLDTVSDICACIKGQMVSDEEFMNSFTVWTAAKSQKEIVRYILSKIHCFIDKNLEINLDSSEVHIEHIMPVNPQNWDIDSDLHEEYLWRLGNLMLLSGPLNISISNGPFDSKKESYRLSKIEPNNLVAKCDTWDKEQIIARQKLLADYAVKIWEK